MERSSYPQTKTEGPLDPWFEGFEALFYSPMM
jgi:hypothetical protein